MRAIAPRELPAAGWRPAPAEAAARPALRLTFGVVALMTFASGLAMPFVLDFVGLIYVTEILLMPTALVALMAARGHRALASPALWAFVVAGLLTLAGYVMSDLVRSTEPALYLRGWAKSVFQAADLVLFCVIVASDRRNVWWYCFGAAIGGLFLQIAIDRSALDTWKTTYAVPVDLLVLCLAPALGAHVAAVCLVLVALVGLVFDSRADPAIVLLVAIAIWARAGQPARPMKLRRFAAALVIPLIVAGLAFAAVFLATQDRFGERREQSNLGRELTFTLGWRAITMSPFVGYGSWSENPVISKLQHEIVVKELGQNRAGSLGDTGFSPHSELLQSWYEGGVLGTAFFFTLLWWLWRTLPGLVLRRPFDLLTGPLLYTMGSGLWHICMSPFAGGHRLDNMLTAGAIVLLRLERAPERPRGGARSA